MYAHDVGAPDHDAARAWWEEQLNGNVPVGIPWATSLGFIRLITHPKVLKTPMPPAQAVDVVRPWLDRPIVEVLEPGPRHLEIFGRLVAAVGVAGSLTTDAHLASLAIEFQCELNSNDADFGRFPGLRWHNPLADYT